MYERHRQRYFNETLRGMLARKELHPWRKLIRQASDAYRREHYALTVPALITIIEGVVMRPGERGTNPLPVIDKYVRALETRAPSPDSFTLALTRITREFLRVLFEYSDFDGPRPLVLNRHWILHGRDVAHWNRADSLRLFQAVDTVSSVAGRSRSPRPRGRST